MPQSIAVLIEELSLQRWRTKLDRFQLYSLKNLSIKYRLKDYFFNAPKPFSVNWSSCNFFHFEMGQKCLSN